MISTLAPINKLISGRVANLPSELQQIILHFACCHPCAVLVRNSADYIAQFIKPPVSSMFPNWGTWIPQPANHPANYNHNQHIIHMGPSLVGPIVPMQPYFWIPPPPNRPLPHTERWQQNNLIKAQRKQRHRSQKSNNRLSKRHGRLRR